MEATVKDFKQGQLVRYYFEGWRVGYYEGAEGGSALIRPLVPKTARAKHIPLEDVENLDTR